LFVVIQELTDFFDSGTFAWFAGYSSGLFGKEVDVEGIKAPGKAQ
jgi:hypothetical protein